MNSYRYNPLPTASNDKVIRLVNLLPGDSSEPIACELITVSLNDISSPKYEAISYAWGESAIRKSIQIVRRHSTGIFQEGSLWITTNLFDFLHERRSIQEHLWKGNPSLSSVNVFLWVDAIAINQQDIPERNHQVRLMRNIYAGAKIVIIWLGRDNKKTGIAVDLVHRLVKANNEQATQNDSRSYHEMGAAGWAQYDLPHPWSPAYPAFASLLQRAWFSRVWIVQEVAYSQSAWIMCGVWLMSWEDFSTAVHFAGDRYLPPFTVGTRNLERVVLIDDVRQNVKADRHYSLLGLLILFRNFKSSEPRDKVYALCGLVRDCGQGALDIKPDYHLTVKQLYQKVAYSILKEGKDLGLLSVLKIPGSSEVGDLPSWVPDWSKSSWKFTISLRTEVGPGEIWPNFEATPVDHGFKVQLKENSPTIMLSGHIVGQITHIGGVHTFQYKDGTSIMRKIWAIKTEQHILNEWERVSQAQSPAIYAATGESMLDAYWTTLIGGQLHGSANTAKAEHLVWDRFYRARFRYIPSLRYSPWTQYIMMPILLVADAIYVLFNTSTYRMVMVFIQKIKLSEERRMFRTETGFIGLASENAQQNDFVGLVKGGMVPLTLRAKGDHWELIGDCYVHGIMNGEGFCATDCRDMCIV